LIPNTRENTKVGVHAQEDDEGGGLESITNEIINALNFPWGNPQGAIYRGS
jgi:hypothetical protein